MSLIARKPLILGLCLGLPFSVAALAQQSPITGTAAVHLGTGLEGEPQSVLSVPVRVDLSGVSYQDKDGNAIDAALGALRLAITYDPAQVAPVLEANSTPGGSTAEFADDQTAHVEATGTGQEKLVLTASQTAEASPTGLVDVAAVPFQLLAASGDITLDVETLDLLSPLAALPDGIIGGESIPHTVTDGIITVTAPTQPATTQQLARAAEDSDADGMPDTYERAFGLDPYNAADAHQDRDGDGLTNLEESSRGTDPNYRHGDINNDGIVDLADVLLAKRIAVGLEEATETQLEPGHGDTNTNGHIDLGDVVAIQRRAMGLDQDEQPSGE
ncbi:dockerin type I repeat-containing protein [Microbulbifer halophilus]|uniref:Dockerin type I repeat-containing protein n=1 Tax=Microbulbifer halophilus TaxID=453963 RepID=A0ABW5EGG3_9GAMM|nr:dockerin type I repeat-containing protein [Microbulbifer halophilus]MCW8127015.1 dockerin type I repeat-containing protein [Microbulbifer halophilus]